MSELNPGARLLIVEDNVAYISMLRNVLNRLGFTQIDSITDSRETFARVEEFRPDLIILDLNMPHLDGFVVMQQLRRVIPRDTFLPVLVLTADATGETKQKALSAGATDLVTKPFNSSDLFMRIRNLLQIRFLHLQLQTQNQTLETKVAERTRELRETQQKVIQQERLAALGTMAGGIAHDFNNALGIIMGFGEVLLRDAEHGLTKENATLPITTILTAAEDAAKIVHRLRAFYRPEETEEQRMPIDLNKLIEQAISLTQPRWQTEATASGRRITITTEPGEIPSIAGDAAELREVLTNLIFNAVDALPQGGTITLGTRQEGEAVALKISDTGTGMSEEVRQRCLEPFFTTKGQRGTGLGLSMVFGVIQRHAGTVEIESELGKGTAFTLRLPPASAENVTKPDVLPWSNEPLRVLVVDDQPILSQLVCKYLQDDLHAVETALSGSDALEKFRADRFDLVITDYVMAEMTGEQLATAIKKLNPKIPVILLTGYAGDSTAPKQHSEAIDLILGKPLSRAALRRALAKVMAVD